MVRLSGCGGKDRDASTDSALLGVFRLGLMASRDVMASVLGHPWNWAVDLLGASVCDDEAATLRGCQMLGLFVRTDLAVSQWLLLRSGNV